MIAEVDPQPRKLARLRQILDGDDRADADVELFEQRKRDDGLERCRRENHAGDSIAALPTTLIRGVR
jgi:hypothetical protein